MTDAALILFFDSSEFPFSFFKTDVLFCFSGGVDSTPGEAAGCGSRYRGLTHLEKPAGWFDPLLWSEVSDDSLVHSSRATDWMAVIFHSGERKVL